MNMHPRLLSLLWLLTCIILLSGFGFYLHQNHQEVGATPTPAATATPATTLPAYSAVPAETPMPAPAAPKAMPTTPPVAPDSVKLASVPDCVLTSAKQPHVVGYVRTVSGWMLPDGDPSTWCNALANALNTKQQSLPNRFSAPDRNLGTNPGDWQVTPASTDIGPYQEPNAWGWDSWTDLDTEPNSGVASRQIFVVLSYRADDRARIDSSIEYQISGTLWSHQGSNVHDASEGYAARTPLSQAVANGPYAPPSVRSFSDAAIAEGAGDGCGTRGGPGGPRSPSGKRP
jgi:hypothetical protein